MISTQGLTFLLKGVPELSEMSESEEVM